jgi:tRNA-dihydrouridine synthase
MFDETGCDGVAVARGALGNPWIFSKTAEHLNNETASCGPDVYEIARIMKEHLALIVRFRGEATGVMHFRKFFSWYLKGLDVNELKVKAFHAITLDKMLRLIDELQTLRGAYYFPGNGICKPFRE